MLPGGGLKPEPNGGGGPRDIASVDGEEREEEVEEEGKKE